MVKRREFCLSDHYRGVVMTFLQTEQSDRIHMRRVKVGCEFVEQTDRDLSAVFQVRPRNEPPVTILKESWSTSPVLPVHEYTDIYGNPCLRTILRTGQTKFTYEALVEVPDATEEVDESAPELAAAELPDEVLIYTLPSRYCLPEMLADDALTLFGSIPPGYLRVQAILDHVWNHVKFQYGTSHSETTSADVYEARLGVCRDFAHVTIAFCRALEIPARYAFGYLPEIEVEPDPSPMDFAAWIEVYLGGRWFTFDPRNNDHRKGRVVIGRGRDAGDVAMVTTFGQAHLDSMTVTAHEV